MVGLLDGILPQRDERRRGLGGIGPQTLLALAAGIGSGDTFGEGLSNAFSLAGRGLEADRQQSQNRQLAQVLTDDSTGTFGSLSGPVRAAIARDSALARSVISSTVAAQARANAPLTRAESARLGIARRKERRAEAASKRQAELDAAFGNLFRTGTTTQTAATNEPFQAVPAGTSGDVGAAALDLTAEGQAAPTVNLVPTQQGGAFVPAPEPGVTQSGAFVPAPEPGVTQNAQATPTALAAPAAQQGIFADLTPQQRQQVAVLGADRNTRPQAVTLAQKFRKENRKQAEAAKKEAARRNTQLTTADIVTTDLDRGMRLVRGNPTGTTGAGGQILGFVGGTDANDLNKLLDTVRANVSFDKLNQMRAASPTGGALGNVTERELALLSATLGNLEQSQSPEQLIFNMKRVKNTFLDIIHGPGNGPRRENLEVPAPAGGGTNDLPRGVTEEDIQVTMQANSMTREQVLSAIQQRRRGQ